MKEPSVPNPQEARLEASVEMGTLCAFYGGLLTDKQLQAMQLHFDEDLSLGEIARQMNVSRQNVHDLIARSSEKLRACEAALGAAGRMERMLERLARVQELLGAIAGQDIAHRGSRPGRRGGPTDPTDSARGGGRPWPLRVSVHKLSSALSKLTGRGKLTEQAVKEGMREVRMALLEADVNYLVVKDFCKKVTERCVGQQVLDSLSPAQQVIKIVNEEMTALMGSRARPADLVVYRAYYLYAVRPAGRR